MATLCAVLLAVIPFAAQAAHTVADIPNVQRIDRSRYVSDPDDIIPAADEARINAALAQVRANTSCEAVVVVVGDIDPSVDENTFATELFTRWGVGKDDKDNGLLMLVVRDRRRAVIRTGYGVEGAIPDVVASRIIRDDMSPSFREGDYAAGIARGVSRIASILGDPSLADELRSEQPDAVSRGGVDEEISLAGLLAMWAWLGVALTIVLAWLTLTRYRRVRSLGPNDKYMALSQLKGPAGAFSILGMGLPLIVYLPLRAALHRWREAPRACPNCGTAMHKLDEETDNKYLTPAQDIEEKINSVDYDVWLCPHCGETDIYPFRQPGSGYVECERCHAITARHSCDRVVVQPTTRSEGQGVHEYTCLACRHISRKRFTIPRTPDPTGAIVAAGILGSLGGSRGGGGGFSGGGFGGGSTGGGGASGGW